MQLSDSQANQPSRDDLTLYCDAGNDGKTHVFFDQTFDGIKAVNFGDYAATDLMSFEYRQDLLLGGTHNRWSTNGCP